MAKKKKKSALPKRIAGFKIPKTLRKRTNSLLANPAGREIVAEAFIAAATAAAAALVRHRPSGAQLASAGDRVADTGAQAAAATKDTVQHAVGAVAEAVAETARAVLPSSLTGAPATPAKPEERAYAPLPERPRRGEPAGKAGKH